MAEKYLQEADRAMAGVVPDRSERVRKLAEADHVAAVRACMANHNWDRDAQTECDK